MSDKERDLLSEMLDTMGVIKQHLWSIRTMLAILTILAVIAVLVSLRII